MLVVIQASSQTCVILHLCALHAHDIVTPDAVLHTLQHTKLTGERIYRSHHHY